jgi:hypothetical protein
MKMGNWIVNDTGLGSLDLLSFCRKNVIEIPDIISLN